MPVIGDVETFYQDGAWRNHVEGSGTTALSFATMAEAVEVGRGEAERANATHVIKNESGQIVSSQSYASSRNAGPSVEQSEDGRDQ